MSSKDVKASLMQIEMTVEFKSCISIAAKQHRRHASAYLISNTSGESGAQLCFSGLVYHSLPHAFCERQQTNRNILIFRCIGYELLLSALNYHQFCDLQVGLVKVKKHHSFSVLLLINSTVCY